MPLLNIQKVKNAKSVANSPYSSKWYKPSRKQRLIWDAINKNTNKRLKVPDNIGFSSQSLSAENTTGPGWYSPSNITITQRLTAIKLITKIIIDLKGMSSIAANNKILCPVAGQQGQFIDFDAGPTSGPYSGKKRFGRFPEIFMKCIEVPLGGEPDINIVLGTGGNQGQDVTGADILTDNGDFTYVGQQSYKIVQPSHLGLTTVFPQFYLTQGSNTAGTYTAGKFEIIITSFADVEELF